MRIKPMFRWYDLWVGVFVDTKSRSVYFFPVPCFGVRIDLPRNPPMPSERYTEEELRADLARLRQFVRSYASVPHASEALTRITDHIEELTRERDALRVLQKKQERREAIDSLRMSPSEPRALDVNGRTYSNDFGRCSHGIMLVCPCPSCESMVTAQIAKRAKVVSP